MRAYMTRLILLSALGLGCGVGGCGGSSGLGTPRPNFEPGLRYGPIIGNVTPNTVTIGWRLDADNGGAVDLRTPGGRWERVSAPARGRVHELTLQGLDAQAEYEYRLVIGGRPLERIYRLRTAPASPDAPLRVAVIGDMGCGCAAQMQLISLIDASDPDLVLLTGDIAYNGGSNDDVLYRFLVPFAEVMARVPLYATLGNHDVTTAGGEPLLSVMPLPTNDEDGTEQYYAFEWGCVRFISLNAEFGLNAPGVPQLRWLDRTLATGREGWTLAFAHRPVYSVGRHGGSAQLRSLVVPMIDDRGVDLFLSGHDHNYQRTHPMRAHGPIPPGQTGGTTYIVSGGGGKSLYDVRQGDPRFATVEASFHFTLIDFTPTEARVRPTRLDGSLIEDVRLPNPRLGR